MTAAPSDTKQIRSASNTPSPVHSAVNRSAKAVQVSVPASSVRPVSARRFRPVRRAPSNTRPILTSSSVPVGRSWTIVPSALTQTVPPRRGRVAPVGAGAQKTASVSAARAASSAVPSAATQRWSSVRPIGQRPQLARRLGRLRIAHLGRPATARARGRPGCAAIRGSRPRAASSGTVSVPQPRQRYRRRRSSTSPASVTRRRGARPFAFIRAPHAGTRDRRRERCLEAGDELAPQRGRPPRPGRRSPSARATRHRRAPSRDAPRPEPYTPSPSPSQVLVLSEPTA